jgi:hypothetical protein
MLVQWLATQCAAAGRGVCISAAGASLMISGYAGR